MSSKIFLQVCLSWKKISLIFFFAVRKFTGDQELEAMGFEMYSGSEINRLVVHIRFFFDF